MLGRPLLFSKAGIGVAYLVLYFGSINFPLRRDGLSAQGAVEQLLCHADPDAFIQWVRLPDGRVGTERDAVVVKAQVGVALGASDGVDVDDGVAFVALARFAPGEDGGALRDQAKRGAWAGR